MRRLLLVFVAVFAACGDHPVEPGPTSGQVAELTSAQVASVFGSGVDAAREVARVGTESITVADVAAWLELFPTLTVEQAVADLVDASAVVQTQGARIDDVLVYDATARARFYVWAQKLVFPELDADGPTDEQIAAFADAVENTSEFGIPELLQVSHLLFRKAGPVAESESVIDENVRAAAARAAADLRALPRVDATALRRYYLENTAQFAAQSVIATVEPHFQFPRRFSGAPRWDGAPAVVDAFSDAVWDAEPGAFIGPIETDFGVHLVVVEARIPARLPDAATRLAMAHDLLVTQHRATALAARLEALVAAASVTIEPDAVNMLAAPESDRLQLEQQGIQHRFDHTP